MLDNWTRTKTPEQFQTARALFVGRALFMGGHSGRILEDTWGLEIISRVTFEDASPEICGEASARPAPDLAHMERVIDHFKPRAVVSLGKLATGACEELVKRGVFIRNATLAHVQGPHPAARFGHVMSDLIAMRRTIWPFL